MNNGVSLELIELEAEIYSNDDIKRADSGMHHSISGSTRVDHSVSGSKRVEHSLSGSSRASQSVTALRNPQGVLMLPELHRDPTARKLGPLCCCNRCRCPYCCRHCSKVKVASAVLLFLILILIGVSMIYRNT